MTERLYYTDAYLTTFTARVVDSADEGRRVYLDRTAFYPTSGGQPHDLGTLGGADVVDVIDEGARVAHLVSTPLTLDSAVEGRVSWARRFDHMQQHTGQHLLSAVLEELFGMTTVSVHFGATSSTLDLEGEQPSREQLVAAEERANASIAANAPVAVTFEDAATATGLRKASDRDGVLRIVSIEGIDRSACGGTHVRALGEIGTILVRRVEKVRKASRIEFVCGLRAIRRARADFEALTAIATSLSAALDEAPAMVAGQTEQLQASESARRKLERELAAYRARELYDGTPADHRGRRTVIMEHASGMDELRAIAQLLSTLPGAVLIGTVESPPSVILAAAEDTGIDAGRTLREVVSSSGGRGGGSARVAQGSAPDIAAVAARLEEVVR